LHAMPEQEQLVFLFVSRQPEFERLVLRVDRARVSRIEIGGAELKAVSAVPGISLLFLIPFDVRDERSFHLVFAEEKGTTAGAWASGRKRPVELALHPPLPVAPVLD